MKNFFVQLWRGIMFRCLYCGGETYTYNGKKWFCRVCEKEAYGKKEL